MVLTINPAVSGTSQRRFAIHVLLFAIGAVVGAFLTASLAFAVVHEAMDVLPARVVVAIVLAPLALVLLRDLGLPVRVPYPSAQVPEWLRHTVPPGVFAPTYGAMLGTGFLTRYTTSAHMSMLVGTAFLPDLRGVLLVALVLAVGKTIAFVPAPKRAGVGELGRRFDSRFYFRRYWRQVLGGASVAVSLALVFVLIMTIEGGPQ